MSFPQIVSQYRASQHLSLRDFAAALNEILPEFVSHQTIANWEEGTHTPPYFTLLPIAMHYSDWRRDFAFDCLAILKPDLYAPSHKEQS